MSTKQLLRSNLIALSVLFAGAAGAYAGEAPGPVETISAKSGAASVVEPINEATGDAKVHCVDPTTCCEESKKVLDLVQKLVAAYAKGDIATYQHYLDDKCAMVDETTKKMAIGKTDVLSCLKDSFAEHAPGGPKPLLSLTIDQPYAKVKGDSCVVTFVATLKTGGPHPTTERANVTDVFVKRNGEWKKSFWQGRWEPVADDKKS